MDINQRRKWHLWKDGQLQPRNGVHCSLISLQGHVSCAWRGVVIWEGRWFSGCSMFSVFRMGYGGQVKLGTHNIHEGNLQGRSRAEPLQHQGRKKKAWDEEEHLRTLRDVRDLLARGPPVGAVAAAEAAAAFEEARDTEEERQEREGGLRQREVMQQFSNWVCEERATKRLGGGREERCKDLGTFVGGSFRGSNGSEMCKRIYDRERERCKVTNGAVADKLDLANLPRRSATTGPAGRRNQRAI